MSTSLSVLQPRGGAKRPMLRSQSPPPPRGQRSSGSSPQEAPQQAPEHPVPSTADLTVGRGKKTKTIKRATTLTEDWGVGRLDMLPELHSLDDSGVIDMLLSTKDIELRGPNQMVTWPNGATSRFVTAEVNQHIIIYEYSSRLGADRRLVLRVNSKATRFSSRGDAVERHHERIIPLRRCTFLRDRVQAPNILCSVWECHLQSKVRDRRRRSVRHTDRSDRLAPKQKQAP